MEKKNCAAVSGASALPTFMFFNFLVSFFFFRWRRIVNTAEI